VAFVHENMTDRAYENVRDSWPVILGNLKSSIESANKIA
jgi:hypothetical protein